MLKSLSIQNYALIDSLEIEFENGFSVITGETGAGKSIILGALSLILGQRAESRFIKHNAQKCTIEGVFDISNYGMKHLFDKYDWEYNSQECIIRREIWTNGKSRAFVNDSPVYLADLKVLSDKLIDIHSQHENLSLNDNLYQLNVVDILANSKNERDDFLQIYKAYQTARKNLALLKDQAMKNKEEEDYLQFQFTALDEAKLISGEQELLETELETITHAEDIKSTLFNVIETLSGERDSVEQRLKSATDILKGISNVYNAAIDLQQRMESAYIELKEIRMESERFFEKIDFNPDRQQILEERLSLLYDLQKKHSVQSADELILILEDLGEKLQNITSLEDKIEIAEKDLQILHENMIKKARVLSEKRKSIVPLLEQTLVEKLHYLGMPNARFKCDIVTKENPDATGIDLISFLFSANKNAVMQPVAQIASGGEISRLMLVIKSMLAGAAALPTIIFDEVDTGTSGEIADKMGTIMKEMGQSMQVMAITHLPQIAAKGKMHFNVYKEDKDDTTYTYMVRLSQKERVDEIARMLSGAETTTQAVANAKVMLSNS